MKLLVAVANYSNPNGEKILEYVHTRNLYYRKSDIDITVLNFSTKEDYTLDGIRVISLKTYLNERNTKREYYDILVSHAANIRDHYVFLKKYEKDFQKLVFFFHGHEVLKINKVYSKPYKYVKNNIAKKIFQNIYDDIKLYIWRKYYTKMSYKSYFIFVSNWMYNEFIKWTKINPKVIEGKYSITYNGVGEEFEKLNYEYSKEKKYDFITIRANLDGSKYSIDIVNELAKNNPEKTFLVVGKGEFFKYNQKAENITWLNKVLDHSEIVKLLNESKCALMPTRTDAQGLMMCEMATYGIPLITSNIPVCREVFEGFNNVEFINNDNINENNINEIYEKIKGHSEKNDKYFYKNTSDKEIQILRKILM